MLTVLIYQDASNCMRTFFYTIQSPACGSDCHWQVCPQRYLTRLKRTREFQDILPISGGISYGVSPAKVTPRSGDIVILYAENSQHLDSMVDTRDGFEGMKKILVVAGPVDEDGSRYHRLEPRYITQAQRDVHELQAVVRRMKSNSH